MTAREAKPAQNEGEPVSKATVRRQKQRADTGALEHEFQLSAGKSARDTNPTLAKATLRALQELFATPDTMRGTLSAAEYHALRKDMPGEKKRRDKEKDGHYIIGATFKRPGTRLAGDVETETLFIGDCDSGKTKGDTIRAKLKGIAHLAYTSFSHTPEHQRWRFIIPLKSPISPDQHERIYEHINELFDGDLDPACKRVNQLYYTPACPHDAAHEYECFVEDGALFDPGSLPATTAEPPPVHRPSTPAAMLPEPDDAALLTGALAFIDPDPRNEWINAGMAIKHDLGDKGLPIWLKWSERSQKFVLADALKEWESLKPNSGAKAITLGSIFYRAQQKGWVNPAAASVLDPLIDELNQVYFIAPYGSKVPVVRETVDPISGRRGIDLMRVPDFKTLLANRTVLVTGNGKPQRRSAADVWLEHPMRRQFDGVVFAPGRDVAGYYNLWRGFAVTPRRGSWKRMRQHLLRTICKGDKNLFDYLIGWLAFAVQHPEVPPGVAVVLQGGRGAGKGLVVREFGKIFGPHFVHISNPQHLTGKFNSHLQSCVLLFVDEGHWAGDKAGEGVLKQLITEPQFTIERKFFEAEATDNHLHIMIASNNDWVVPAGPRERRFCVLEVDDKHLQDPKYFDPIYAEMDGGGREAMLHDLLRMDLGGFNVRDVPHSPALGEQKLLSLEAGEKWWFGCLVEGNLWPLGQQLNRPPWGSVVKDVLHDKFVESLKKSGVTHRSTQTELGKLLSKLLPKGFPKSPRRTTVPSAPPVAEYEFPALDVCRAHFEKVIGFEGDVDWNAGRIAR